MTETDDVDQIVADLPMDALATRLGVDPRTAEAAVRQALPALLGGMHANAADPSGAASLSGAIDQHSPALIDGGVDLDAVDAADGERIVGHVFGARSPEVTQTLGQTLGEQEPGAGAGGGAELMRQLLPILAPIVLSYLARRMRGGSGHTTGVEDLLGSILGGLAGGGGRQGGGGILDVLGGLLGGGRRG